MKTFADYQAAGNIPEDVINALFDISVTDRPYTGTIAHMGASSSLKEWLDHELRAPSKTNAIIDGADATADDTSEGTRYVQPMQLQEAGIRLGDQAQESDSFGNIAKFETQLEKRVNELYRDLEARSLSEEASVLPVSNTVAGEQAGFFAQVSTATAFGVGGADGGWNSITGVFDSPTPGTSAAMSEDTFLGICETMSVNGSSADNCQMIPALKRRFSSYLFSSSSRIGVLVTQTEAGEGGARSVASVAVIETDFFTLELVNNRIMQEETATRSNLAIIQRDMAECIDQWTPRAKRLGPTGAGEKWQVTNSAGTILLNEKAHGAYRDINHTVDVVA